MSPHSRTQSLHCPALTTEMVSLFNSIWCRTAAQSQLQNQQDKLLKLLERFSPVRKRYPVLLFLVRSLMILTPGDFKHRELFGKLVPLNPAEKSELWEKSMMPRDHWRCCWSHRDDSLPVQQNIIESKQSLDTPLTGVRRPHNLSPADNVSLQC